jgi:hypothetical protein
MTKTFAQAAAFAFAAVLTAGTFAGANGIATQQYAKADVAASAGQELVALQTVVVVGHRAKA